MCSSSFPRTCCNIFMWNVYLSTGRVTCSFLYVFDVRTIQGNYFLPFSLTLLPQLKLQCVLEYLSTKYTSNYLIFILVYLCKQKVCYDEQNCCCQEKIILKNTTICVDFDGIIFFSLANKNEVNSFSMLSLKVHARFNIRKNSKKF